ncbi:MAG: hypothetical protein CME62_12925 [Halobacteriovoraceae bacterium]|nr:hypothetical protein [Halobacteriovoraceae bacterium]|tara:strand:+ start:31198 stop:32232 length:1035 start_codon:yes stop_codon:yes gene_type:complete
MSKNTLLMLKDFSQTKHTSPSYYFDLDGIKRFYQSINDRKISNLKVLFPVKSFPSKYFLEAINPYIDGFDISNANELSLVEKYDKILWSSSPMNYLAQDERVICDISDISMITQAKNYSLRINLSEASRFGVPLSEINREHVQDAAGVHIHNQGWGKDVMDELFNDVKKITTHFTEKGIKRFNLGGGFSNATLSDFLAGLEKICNDFPDITFFIEPGRMVITPNGFIFGRVSNIQNVNSQKLTRVTTTISPLCHLRWEFESAKIKFFTTTGSKKTTAYKNAIVVGETCYEGDILLKTENLPLLGINDIVSVSNVSSYGAVWNHAFNGIEKAQLKLVDGGEIVCI